MLTANVKKYKRPKKSPLFSEKKINCKTQLIKQQISFDKDNIGLFYRQ